MTKRGEDTAVGAGSRTVRSTVEDCTRARQPPVLPPQHVAEMVAITTQAWAGFAGDTGSEPLDFVNLVQPVGGTPITTTELAP